MVVLVVSDPTHHKEASEHVNTIRKLTDLALKSVLVWNTQEEDKAQEEAGTSVIYKLWQHVVIHCGERAKWIKGKAKKAKQQRDKPFPLQMR